MTLPHAKARSIAARPLIAALFLCSYGLPALAQTVASPPSPPPAPKPAVLEAEQAYTEKMTPPDASWAFVRTQGGGTAIFDAKTGKMKGTVSTSPSSDLGIDPAGKFYYVSETMWTKIGRGTRQDMVTVYDSTDMKLQSEIPMPGRLIIGGRKQDFIVSDDGKTGYVYNMDPASSVNMIDLVKRKFVRAIELPGCASLVPVAGVGFSALCSDGSLATVATMGAKPAITRSAPFFDPKGDPIYDNFTYDKVKGEVTYVTYTGLIYQVKLGATPTIGTPWSLQAAAGIRPGETKPLEVNWLPGGTTPFALHRKSGHLFVLMHMGEYWSQKASGTEVWEVDLAAHKVVKRMPLENPAGNIEVTQDENPMLFVNERKGNLWIFDAKTYEQKYKVENGGGGVIASIDPR
jgi:methylamine dehydrogenase heavy chain